MAWVMLGVAGIFEVVWATFMKLSEGFTKLGWTLLTFAGTPNLDAVFNEPLHKERRFILSAAQTVKHEHQQHVKLLLFG